MSKHELTLDKLAVYLDAMSHVLDDYDPTPVLEQIRDDLVKSVRDNFAGAHAPGGRRWPRLKVRDHPPLVRTGLLLQAAEEAALHSLRSDGSIVIDFGEMPDYALFQQEGTRTIPARPFIGITKKMADAALDALIDDVTKKLNSI